MSGFSSISPFGDYRPLNTPLHRLDPRVKFFLLVVAIVTIFLPYGSNQASPYPYAMSMTIGGAVLLLLLAGMGMARISILRFLSALKGIWLLLLAILIINMFFWVPDSSWEYQAIAFKAWNRPVYYASFLYCAYVVERIMLMILATLVLTASTKPLDMAYSIEWFGKPLGLLRIPVSAIGLMMTLALRFIPVLGSEAERIQKAQAARGLDYVNGRYKDKFRSIVSLVIPLMVLSFMHAEELAQTMAARGYDPYAKRTRYRAAKIRVADFVWLFSGILLLAGAIFLSAYEPDGQRLDLFVWLKARGLL